MNPAEPDQFSFLRVIMAFGIVAGLMGLMGYGLKYISTRGIKWPSKTPVAKRLELVETLAIDVRRRLVIVRCDGREHLLLLGANQDLVVQSDLDPVQKT